MRRELDFPWTLALALAAIAATACALSSGTAHHLADVLVADDRLARQPWRALTGPLVHATWGHLVRDLALTLLVGAAYERELRDRWLPLLGAALIAPTVAVLATGAAAYYGLSGVSHALIAAALGLELRRRRGGARIYVAVIASACAIKLLYEAASGGPAFPMDLGPHVRQVPIAHLIGALVGAAFGLCRIDGPRRLATT
ncbi:MAG: rhomboid family intramembrane serine protease [Deltaproteobacteria bacterium]|nr:rhomboid family intramembrane serine protease [Deltaproteobacteria bacterium]